MKTLSRILVSTALLAGVAPAFAGNVAPAAPEGRPVAAPVSVPVSWAGPYVGGQLGYTSLDTDGVPEAVFGVPEDLSDFDTDDDGDDDFVFDDDGLSYGLHAGYNVQRGNFVFGPELRIYGSDLEIGGESNFDDGDPEDRLDVETNFGADLMMRGGIVQDRNLFYVTAGASYLDLSVETGGPFFGETSEDYSDWGYAIGLGAERLVQDNIVVGVQYTYRRFDDFDFDDTLIDGTEIDVDSSTIELRASFRF